MDTIPAWSAAFNLKPVGRLASDHNEEHEQRDAYLHAVSIAMGYPGSSAIGLLNASAFIAGFFTMPVAAYIADRWGRRWCIKCVAA